MFTKDERQENFLTFQGVKWHYSNKVTFAQLKPGWDVGQYGRSGKARWEEVILEFAARMEAGSPAPAPILRSTPLGFDPLDGVQRLGAAQLRGAKEFSAYIVETDSELLARKIRILANHLLAGHPEPASWTRKQAIQVLAIEGGMSLKEVAQAGGWPLSVVQQDEKEITWGFAIRTIGGPEQIAKGILLTTADHAKMDDLRVAKEPIAKFFGDLKQGKFSNGESEAYISAFFNVDRKNRKRLYDRFAKNLEHFREDPEVQTRLSDRPKGLRPHDIKLRGAMKAVLTITEELLTDKHDVLYVEEFFQLWNQVEGNLKTLAKRKKGKVLA